MIVNRFRPIMHIGLGICYKFFMVCVFCCCLCYKMMCRFHCDHLGHYGEVVVKVMKNWEVCQLLWMICQYQSLCDWWGEVL